MPSPDQQTGAVADLACLLALKPVLAVAAGPPTTIAGQQSKLVCPASFLPQAHPSCCCPADICTILTILVAIAVRVRPPLNPNDPGYELIPQRFQRSMVQTTSDTTLTIDSPQGRKLFVFDRVFNPQVMQEGIWDYLSESINSFTQGYNVSLLAYGQSGAGKSYTMGTSGPDEQYDEDMMGMIWSRSMHVEQVD